ncbi:hypothetical protein CspeluHIS016_0601980 [Cutaneotrichosporon spelunceum]|uniref:DNA mismatch repair proteins mutS family domain-containing protein n=1 Tax=Cutaneotrichosporon spelunceum TaxID=1672016 RepID=A0AAD3TYA1_9TREE|nr:hypothetical protein CspeluHIS016_0601980 [Cutaneotrichosporon spelunceum]
MHRQKRGADYIEPQEDEPRQRPRAGQHQHVGWSDEPSPPHDVRQRRLLREVPLGFKPQAEDEEYDALEPRHIKILAIHAPIKFNVAAAFYDSQTRRLKILEDTKDTWAWDLCRLLCEQCQPHKILISAHAPDTLAKIVDEFCVENPETLSIGLPPREFHYALAQHQLANVKLTHDKIVLVDADGEGASLAESEEDEDGAGLGRMRLSLLKMGCRVNVDAPNGVSAAGALISYIVQLMSAEAHTDDMGFGLDTIESMDMEEHMLINHDALTSLAVFDIENHASMYSNDQKQATSLNGILDTTITGLGKKLFHTWLLRPLLNVERINERFDAVETLIRGPNVALLKELGKQLKGFANMLVFCTRIKAGRGKWKDWQQLVLSLTAARDIKDTLSRMRYGNPLPVAAKIGCFLSDEVLTFLNDVVAIIDWDMSCDMHRICVRPGVDDEIDKCREDYAGLEPLLNQMSIIMGSHTPPGMCEEIKVIYLPQMGCFVAACNMYRRELIPPDWSPQFEAKNQTYFKTPQMENLDDHYGDLLNITIDLEIEWVQRLIQRLDPLEWQLMSLANAIAEVDCLLAFATATVRLSLKRPNMTDEPTLKIRNGWHPLYAMSLPPGQYIANDTFLDAGGDPDMAAMTVVTGANGSGKSAYGKQIALITYMAHIGCFVPAAKATIGVCDKIFTRIQTRESASKTASAFMIDLSQVSQAIRGATSRSLIILDEFGKGTSPSDGAGLLAGVLTHLLQGPNPRTVVLTHFHELLAQEFLDPRLKILNCHMKSISVENSIQPTFLYKATPGPALSSYAAECALLHGIDPDVVDRARKVSHLMATNQIEALVDGHMDDKDYEEIERHEQLTRQFLSWDLDDDEMDVLGELELMVQALETAVEVKEEVPLGEIPASVSAFERSVETDKSAWTVDSLE